MLVIIRSNDVVSDPRSMKYINFLRDKGIEYKIIGWDRDLVSPSLENSTYFKHKAKYNAGGFYAVKNRLLWMKFVYLELRRIRQKSVSLHGCDLDSAFPAAVYKLFHPNYNLIFDIFDWFSATLYDQKSYIRWAFKIMEWFTVKNSDSIIICEKERIDQISFKIDSSRLFVLPNIPSFNNEDFIKEDASLKFDNDKLTFSYVGGFSEDRCLFELLEIAKNGIINLSIAGFGHDELEKQLKMASDKYNNIRYYGKVDYQRGLNISYNSDIMYAMYSPVNPNNVYAAPNKYYEAMFLGKPIFTSKNTILEKKVSDRQMGYLAFDNLEDIQDTIINIERSEIAEKGMKSKSCWLDTYSEYTYNFLNSSYLKMIRNDKV